MPPSHHVKMYLVATNIPLWLPEIEIPACEQPPEPKQHLRGRDQQVTGFLERWPRVYCRAANSWWMCCIFLWKLRSCQNFHCYYHYCYNLFILFYFYFIFPADCYEAARPCTGLVMLGHIWMDKQKGWGEAHKSQLLSMPLPCPAGNWLGAAEVEEVVNASLWRISEYRLQLTTEHWGGMGRWLKAWKHLGITVKCISVVYITAGPICPIARTV